MTSSSSPLRILVVSGTPSAYPELRIDAEVAGLRRAIERAPNIAIEILVNPTIAALGSALEAAGRGHFDVLHYIGHGRCHRGTDSGTLSFAGEHSPVHAVHPNRLIGVFSGRGVDLVVLNACESAGTGNADPFAGIAMKLLSVVPSVIAMPLMISGESVSIAFAEALYAALAAEIPIEEAANLARARVAAEYEKTDSPIRLMVRPESLREDGDITTAPPITPVRVADDVAQLNLQPRFDARSFARASTSRRSTDSRAQEAPPPTTDRPASRIAKRTQTTRNSRWGQTFGRRLRQSGMLLQGARYAEGARLRIRTELLRLIAKLVRIATGTRGFAEAEMLAAKRAWLSFAETSMRSKRLWLMLVPVCGIATAIAWPAETAHQGADPSTLVEESPSAVSSIQPKPGVNTYLSRGQAHYIQGDYEWAIDDFTDALRLQPTCVFAYNARGLAYEKRGSIYEDKDGYDRAIADYTRALQLEPEYAVVYGNRGIAYDERGMAFADESDSDRAIADYTHAIYLASDFVGAYAKRGLVYDNEGKSGRAIADFNHVIRLEPDNSDAYDNRAHAYRSKGDDKDAIADYTRAVKLRPDDENAYSDRGDAYEHQGNRNRAVADYRRAVLLKPDDLEASIRLDRIVRPT